MSPERISSWQVKGGPPSLEIFSQSVEKAYDNLAGEFSGLSKNF